MPGSEFYSDEEQSQILQAALRIDELWKFDQQSLEMSAAELGISPEALQKAKVQVLAQRHQVEFDRHRLSQLRSHLAVYLVMSLGLIITNLLTDRHYFWFIWPLLGWGIGVAIHALTYYFPQKNDYNREFRAWKKRNIADSQEETEPG